MPPPTSGPSEKGKHQPSHTYTTGTYTVSLTATGPGGEDTSTATIVARAPTPNASFTPSTTSGVSPLTVTFSNTSEHADTFLWSFGDGATSTEAEPSHTYTTGTYAVHLTAAGAGGEDVSVATIVVQAPPSPQAAFVPSAVTGTSPLAITFSNTSEHTTSYLWSFGDGATSTEAEPSHIYDTPGSYTVRLTAAGAGGEDSSAATIAVQAPTPTTPVEPTPPITPTPPVAPTSPVSPPAAQAPSASFIPSAVTGTSPLTVTFSNTSEHTTSYLWSFGDGGTSTGKGPSHIYDAPGSYTVRLTAAGPGGEATGSKKVVVTPGRPDLIVGLGVHGSKHQVGDKIVLNLSVRNKAGARTAQGVKLQLTVKGLIFVSLKNSGLVCHPAKTRVLCTAALLPAGGRVSGRVIVRVVSAGTLPITLSAKSKAIDANGTDNKASQTIIAKTWTIAKPARSTR